MCEGGSLLETENASQYPEFDSCEESGSEAGQEAGRMRVSSSTGYGQLLDTADLLQQSGDKQTEEWHKDICCEAESNDQLIAAFFERLAQKEDPQTAQKGDNDHSSSSEYQKRADLAERGYFSDSRNSVEKTNSRATDRLHLTQYAGTVRLITDVDFSGFLKR